MTSKLIVNSYKGGYEVHFSNDFVVELRQELRSGDVLIVDSNVSKLHRDRIEPLLADWQHILVQPAEAAKSYMALAPLIERLIRTGFRKNHRLIALGGGITQDVTAFIASILYRGVDWIFVPTNLLAQADSCIGSKTSINFGAYKNQLGGFHPPKVIINDLSFLATLGREEMRSGMGEMLHYFLIDGRASFDWIRENYDRAFTDRDVLREMVHRSLEIKRKMIEIDEFDAGPRNIFNYGHSFGHAIESYTNYAIPHGIAVSFGMDLANHVSVRLGLLAAEECDEMQRLLAKNYNATRLPEMKITEYIDLLRKDKKNIDQNVRLILTRGLGKMFITNVELDTDFCRVLEKQFERFNLPL